ncbi:hypothetical protein BGZ96_000465 [Linnemannia gamsii]|uniref:Uncharacterized protein n=1 Tax=Linnemannia gamsii TaxID=64522 RepID=A0ABQ7JP09_9FUNG|nr:hypothetical protein BGZ96_000465 [Linnemannia gamsii]
MTIHQALLRSKFTLGVIINIALLVAYLLDNNTSAGQNSNLDKLLQELQEFHKKILKDQRQLELTIAEQRQLLDNVASKQMPNSQRLRSLEKESRLLHSFQATEELLKTHDIAIPRDVPEWSETDTAYLNTVAGFDMMAGMLKEDYIKQQKIVTKAAVDFAWISRKERVYKSLSNSTPAGQRGTTAGPSTDTAGGGLLSETRAAVVPMDPSSPKTSLSLHESLQGWGFVFCGGDKQFQMMVTSIQSLRLKLHSQLPIQVFHMGEKDLSHERQEYIRQMTYDIEVIDISDSWTTAILSSKAGPSNHLRSLLPSLKKLSSSIQMLTFSGFWERDLSVYQTFYGDKETFYIGFELVQEPYAFVRNYGGVIGELKVDDDQSICGAQMHLDYQGKPLWWNSGLVKNKNNEDMRDLYFGYWMSGGGNQTNRELLKKNDEMKDNLAYELELDSVDDLPQPEEPIDPVWDYLRGCMRGWKVEALPEDEAQRTNSYVVMDRISKKVDSLIVQHMDVDPKGDWNSI